MIAFGSSLLGLSEVTTTLSAAIKDGGTMPLNLSGTVLSTAVSDGMPIFTEISLLTAMMTVSNLKAER